MVQASHHSFKSTANEKQFKHECAVDAKLDTAEFAIKRNKLTDAAIALNEDTGYKLPFVVMPDSVWLKNNESSLKHVEFIGQAIHELLEKNCISEVNDVPYCCNPLSVVEDKKAKACVRCHCRQSDVLWSEQEQAQSSTYRELKAIMYSLQSFVSVLAGKKLHYGSSNQALQNIAVNIFQFFVKNAVNIAMQWIPRKENELADYISKIVDPDDWMLHPNLFALIQAMWERRGVVQYEDLTLEEFVARYTQFCSALT
ncbi:predicted protein [Nematostella vectensis]|uniref:Uncharacterized protein n=1 Tax=Nematostella vectensis TaxID=45351 RepID=A7S2E5_NEMVE|nr:predicted protein [Nematostella vectensis]|eukprot:XP_001634194.1 predicted protein [Nematostella vectensis]